MDSILIGKKIKTMRGTKTQEEIASACGITTSSLSMYETGRRIPRDEIKVRLAAYFGVSIGELFFEENSHA